MLTQLSLAGGLVGCLISMAACSSASGVKAGAGSAPDSAPPQSAASQEDPVVAKARAALRGSGVDDAVFRSSTPTVWNDSSLGCPRPGMNYLQVIMEGHAVKFDTPNGPRTVHVAGESVVICTQQATGVPKQPQQRVRASALEAMHQAAREDLAGKLDRPVEDVKVVSSMPFTWDGGSFRCGQPAPQGESDTVSGYKLQLRAGADSFVYHTDFRTAFACPAIERE